MMPTVLIIEDDESLRDGLKTQLEKDNYRVLTAEDGAYGLQRALTEKPDIILLDVIIPHIDGLAVLSELRKNEWGKNVPVMMLTSITDNEQMLAAQKHGIVDFLVKTDWTFQDISHQITKRLSEHTTSSN